MSAQHTPGPWRFEFNAKHRRVHLVGGRPQYDLSIMAFCRWGMSGATMLLRDTAHNGMNIMHKLHERPDWVAPEPGREHHRRWHQLLTHPDIRLIEAAPDMLAALVVAREFISFERNAFADCNGLPDGTFAADEAAELADYDTALLQINAAILKATGAAA